MSLDLIPSTLQDLYEVRQWRQACAVLKQDFPSEFEDVIDVLARFRLPKSGLVRGGGNENPATSGWFRKRFEEKGWKETEFDVVMEVDGTGKRTPTHSIDCS